MPGFDGSGPMGDGPMSGRGMGYCTGYQNGPRTQGYGWGRGFRGGRGGGFGWGGGHGRGRGFGWGAGQAWQSPLTPADEQPLNASQEIKVLNAQLKQHRAAMDDIQRRLNELEKGTGE